MDHKENWNLPSVLFCVGYLIKTRDVQQKQPKKRVRGRIFDMYNQKVAVKSLLKKIYTVYIVVVHTKSKLICQS